MSFWLWGLFFIAIALGYVLGYRDHKRKQKKRMSALTGDYAKGINYLLNEQPDQAVDVLMECLLVNEQTLETHLSLARIFRRRGEMDRATRIHNNLLESSELSAAARDDVVFELALDYHVSGVFDRAEQIFQDMIENKSRHRYQAMQHLMQIFEQEKDWHSALAVGEKMRQSQPDVSRILAHYCCELALHQQANESENAARRTLRRALTYDKKCARAWLLRGKLEWQAARAKAALSAYLSLYGMDGELFDEVLPEVESAYRHQRGETEWLRFLADACIEQPSTPRVLRLATGLEEYFGEEEATHLLTEYLKENPSVQGLRRFIELKFNGIDEPLREPLGMLQQLTRTLSGAEGHYQCRKCGFNANEMHWQCPSCKSWGSIRPKRTEPQPS